MHRLTILVASLLALPHATTVSRADERPLIWNVLEASSTAYSARLGTRLPTSKNASIGADFKLRGPDPAQSRDQVIAWVQANIIEPATAGNGHALSVEGKVDSDHANRSVTLRNALRRTSTRLEAEVKQEVAIDVRPADERRRFVRHSQEVTVKALATGTEMRFRASREGEEPWQTHLALTQHLRPDLELSASVDNPGHGPSGRIAARYRLQW